MTETIKKETIETKTINKILPSYEELKWTMLAGESDLNKIPTRKFYFSYLAVKKELKKILEACPFSEEAFEDVSIERDYGYDEDIPFLKIVFANGAATFWYKHSSYKHSDFTVEDSFYGTDSEKAEAIKANEKEVLKCWDESSDRGISIVDYVKEYLKFYESTMCSDYEEEYFKDMEQKAEDFETYSKLISKVLPPYKELKEKLLSHSPKARMEMILKFHANYETYWRGLYKLLKNASEEQLKKFKKISMKKSSVERHGLPKEIVYDVIFFEAGRNYLLFSYKTLEDLEHYSFDKMKKSGESEMDFSKTYTVEIFKDCNNETIFEKVKKFLETSPVSEFKTEKICGKPVSVEEAHDEETEELNFDKIIASSTPEEIESDFINIKSGTATINYSTGKATMTFTTDVLTAIKLMMKMKREKI